MKYTSDEKHEIEKQIEYLLNSELCSTENLLAEIMDIIEDSANNKKSTVVQWAEKMFEHANKKEWFETYHAIDIHGTVSKPDYRKDSKKIIYYPFAKKTLQLMSEREDIKLIMFTSSYPDEIEKYNKFFKNDNINFNYINENPEISIDNGAFGYYEDKFYFNLLLEDKAGFDPNSDWELLYNYFKSTEYRPNKKWTTKVKEKYHQT